MSITKIESVGRKPLSTIVYENIKKAIIDGNITPGTRLTETKVSEQLGVSTTPVREAFRRLESERFVKNIPYKGAVVQKFSTREIEEVYQCRVALEVLAIETVTETIDNKGITALRKIVAKSKHSRDFQAYEEMNTAIHNKILSYANNETLQAMLTQLNEVIYHNRSMFSLSDQRRIDNYEEHVHIIEALEDKNLEEAKRAMETHIKNAYTYIQEQIHERQTVDATTS